MIATLAGVSQGSIVAGMLTVLVLGDFAIWALFIWHQPGVVVDEEKITVDPSGDAAHLPLTGIKSIEYSESNRVLTVDYLAGSSRQVTLPRLDRRDLARLLADLRIAAGRG